MDTVKSRTNETWKKQYFDDLDKCTIKGPCASREFDRWLILTRLYLSLPPCFLPLPSLGLPPLCCRVKVKNMVQSTPRPYNMNLYEKNMLSAASLFAGGFSKCQDFGCSLKPSSSKCSFWCSSSYLKDLQAQAFKYHRLFDLQACNSWIHLAAASPDIWRQPVAQHAICLAGTVFVFVCFISHCHSDVRVRPLVKSGYVGFKCVSIHLHALSILINFPLCRAMYLLYIWILSPPN